jgi:hypothetical protein
MQTHEERQNDSTQITHDRTNGGKGQATRGEVSYYQFMSQYASRSSTLSTDFRNKFLYAFVIYDIGSTKRAALLNHIQEIWNSNSDSETFCSEVFGEPAGKFLKYGHNPFTLHGLASSLYTEQSSHWTL